MREGKDLVHLEPLVSIDGVKPKRTDPALRPQGDYLTDVNHSHAANPVLWMPINFIRRNRGLYHFVKGLRSIKRNGLKEIVKILPFSMRSQESSLETETQLTKGERQSQEKTSFPKNTKISIITPLCNTPEQYVREMIESVLAQTYKNWELCLTDGSDKEHGRIKDIIIGYAQKDKRIKYKKLDKNLGISGNLNKAIEMSSGEYLGFLDQNDLLHPSALHEVMKAI